MAGVLITGAAGMVGSHLLEHLAADPAAEVLGSYYRATINLADIEGRVPLVELDVRRAHDVAERVTAQRPAVIYHLAAQSLPTRSWEDPFETLEINVQGTVAVFEAVRAARRADHAYDPMVVVACSSAEYGASLVPERLPVDEDAPLLPLHPYGVSKVAQDLLAFQYWRNERIRCIRARIFNSTGPRKRNDVVSDFAARIAAMGDDRRLRVGNLETRRAILDVRDLIGALTLLAERGEPGEAYNICAERLVRVGDLLPIFESLAGFTVTPDPDPALFRPSDEPVIMGRTDRLRAATGWQQHVTLEETVAAVFEYEQRVAAGH